MDWLKTLAMVAPTVATAIGGPMAGMAVKVASDALGIDSSEQAVSDAVLAGDPETLKALKEAELQFKTECKRLGIRLKELDQKDRQSARDLAKINMIPQVVLSSIYTIGYVIVLWQFMTGEVVIPVDSKIFFGTVLGILTAAQTQIMNFWFGSSHGSKTKDSLSGAE